MASVLNRHVVAAAASWPHTYTRVSRSGEVLLTALYPFFDAFGWLFVGFFLASALTSRCFCKHQQLGLWMWTFCLVSHTWDMLFKDVSVSFHVKSGTAERLTVSLIGALLAVRVTLCDFGFAFRARTTSSVSQSRSRHIKHAHHTLNTGRMGSLLLLTTAYS